VTDRFPFGAPSIPRPARLPTSGPVRFAVVGVYPSALHVRWTVPEWALTGLGLSRHVAALAVDVEPTVFWDGHNPEPSQLVSNWRETVGFIEGDSDGQHGHVVPAMNGTSGVAVTEKILAPLGISPDETYFTDLVPRFFVKRAGAAGAAQQADRIDDTYTPFATATGLPAASLPDRPTPARLVELAVTEEAARLRQGLTEAGADLVVSLGEEARRALTRLTDEAAGPPTANLQLDQDYGQPGTARIEQHRFWWVALTHPGNRNPAWRDVHGHWMQHTAPMIG
jgi:hypothetical protein